MGEIWPGEATTGDGDGTERKGIGIHPTRGPLQLFSRGCAYITSPASHIQARINVGVGEVCRPCTGTAQRYALRLDHLLPLRYAKLFVSSET